LHQPYAVHVERNSSGVITSITTHTAQTVLVINSALEIATAVVVALGLLAALVSD
jgi:ATP-binding cassette subfamily B protein